MIDSKNLNDHSFPFSIKGNIYISEYRGKEGNTPTSYLWDFGDGNKSSEKNPIHTYTETGIFTVSLTIIDVDGDFNTLIKKNYITISNS